MGLIDRFKPEDRRSFEVNYLLDARGMTGRAEEFDGSLDDLATNSVLPNAELWASELFAELGSEEVPLDEDSLLSAAIAEGREINGKDDECFIDLSDPDITLSGLSNEEFTYFSLIDSARFAINSGDYLSATHHAARAVCIDEIYGLNREGNLVSVDGCVMWGDDFSRISNRLTPNFDLNDPYNYRKLVTEIGERNKVESLTYNGEVSARELEQDTWATIELKKLRGLAFGAKSDEISSAYRKLGNGLYAGQGKGTFQFRENPHRDVFMSAYVELGQVLQAMTSKNKEMVMLPDVDDETDEVTMKVYNSSRPSASF